MKYEHGYWLLRSSSQKTDNVARNICMRRLNSASLRIEHECKRPRCLPKRCLAHSFSAKPLDSIALDRLASDFDRDRTGTFTARGEPAFGGRIIERRDEQCKVRTVYTPRSSTGQTVQFSARKPGVRHQLRG
jgi:hypothetical protein